MNRHFDEAISRSRLTIQELAFISPLASTRFTLGLTEVLWGLLLLLPGDSFNNDAYRLLAGVMSEDLWGILLVSTGILQWVVLLARRYHETPSVIFSGYNAALWVFICTSLLASNCPTLISSEIALMLAAIWVFIRSGPVDKHKAKEPEK